MKKKTMYVSPTTQMELVELTSSVLVASALILSTPSGDGIQDWEYDGEIL